MPTHYQSAKMNQKKIKLTKQDKKEIKRDKLKKEIKKKPQARQGVPAPSTKGKKKPRRPKPTRKY